MNILCFIYTGAQVHIPDHYVSWDELKKTMNNNNNRGPRQHSGSGAAYKS